MLIISVCKRAGEGFSVAFDPLDGSSIVDTNFTVGTIFGVWPGDKLIGVTGRDQVNTPVIAMCHSRNIKSSKAIQKPFITVHHYKIVCHQKTYKRLSLSCVNQ